MSTMYGDVRSIFHLCVIVVTLTFLTSLLRFVIRGQSKTPFATDDAWLIISLLVFYANLGILLWVVTQRSLESAPGKVAYATVPLAISTVAAAKISILCLYRRIFTTPSFRRDSLVVGLAVVSYWVASLLGFLLACTPVQAAWQTQIRGKCIDRAALFLGLELVNCILDLAILCLPLRVIHGLQMPLKRKLGLGFVFTLGSLVFVIGIVRMAICYRANSESMPMYPNIVTATLENALAIICANLPVCGPVLSAQLYSDLYSKMAGSLGLPNRKGQFARLQGEPETQRYWPENAETKVNSTHNFRMVHSTRV